VETAATNTQDHSNTDAQEQIHQLTNKLQKAQSENVALTRDKKRLEAQLEDERRRVKQLEVALARKEAEVLDLRRKAKASPSHATAKKGETPVSTRKITDSSPRSLRKVGSGEKATPTGSPAESRKPRSGVTRETTSSVADTRKKFIQTVTSSAEIKRKLRSSRYL
jgi:chromosome segregation ATPase